MVKTVLCMHCDSVRFARLERLVCNWVVQGPCRLTRTRSELVCGLDALHTRRNFESASKLVLTGLNALAAGG